MSIGTAVRGLVGEQPLSAEAAAARLIELADRALYVAKGRGRNRVEASRDA